MEFQLRKARNGYIIDVRREPDGKWEEHVALSVQQLLELLNDTIVGKFIDEQ